MTNTFPQRLTRFGIFFFAATLPFSHVPAQFGIAFAALGWIADGVLNKQWKIRSHRFFIPLLFYLGWNFLASALSPRPLHSILQVFDNEWAVIIMLMLFWTVDSVQMLVRIVLVFLTASSVGMLYAIWQSVTGIEFVRGRELAPFAGYFRGVGFHGFYLTFAGFAMTIFFLAISFVVEVKEKGRKWLLGLALVSFLAVLGTFARSIWLSLAAAIPLFAFSRSKKVGVIVTSAFILFVVVAALSVPALQERIVSIANIDENITRLNLWKTAIKIWTVHPITGVGEDNWDYFFPLYRVEGYYDTVVHPHNDYLNVLVASGVPGLVAFLAMWGIAISVGFSTALGSSDARLRGIVLGATCSLVGFLVGSFFQNYYGTFINCLTWWFIVGLIFSAVFLNRVSSDSNGQTRS